MRFGDLFNNVRAAVGMNQNDMAESLGITQATLSKIEADDLEPRASTLLRLVFVATEHGEEAFEYWSEFMETAQELDA